LSGGLLNEFYFIFLLSYKTVRAQKNIHKVRETTIKPEKEPNTTAHTKRENREFIAAMK
jgi:hypothetical protein